MSIYNQKLLAVELFGSRPNLLRLILFLHLVIILNMIKNNILNIHFYQTKR